MNKPNNKQEGKGMNDYIIQACERIKGTMVLLPNGCSKEQKQRILELLGDIESIINE